MEYVEEEHRSKSGVPPFVCNSAVKYKAAKQDMIAYRTAKQNVDRIWGLEQIVQEQQHIQKSER